jgi:pimeloyl-ACP methyl ester carboxylesterase
VILDYVRHYGEDALGGIHFVNGISKLGSDAALAVLTPEFLALVPSLLSDDPTESSRGLRSLLRLCFVQEPAEADVQLMLGYNLSVPPYVRQALFARSVDNDDVMGRIRKPVLITHGADEAVVKTAVVDQHKLLMPHAEVDVIAGAGHALFWESAPGFNQRLKAFAASVWREGVGAAG